MENFEVNPSEAAPQTGDPSGDNSAQLTELQKRVTELEAQVKEKEARYVYLYADFENYKKRAIKERADLLKFGWENSARELLQVIDNLERALAHMPADTSKVLTDGLHMVLNQFRATLEKQGVQRIQTEKAAFDPNLHEAIAQEPSEHHPVGTIVIEHVPGYTMHGRLLRPARVVVSAGK